MTLASATEVAPLEGMSPAELKAWLRVGMERCAENGGRNYWGFVPLGLFFRQSESLVENLRGIYELLSAKGKQVFRNSLVDFMAELDPVDGNVPILIDLMHLAALLPAKDVLRILPAKIGAGGFGRLDGHKDEIFAIGLEAAASLVSQTKASADCIRALAGFPNFQTAYAGLTLISLCRAEPKGFLDHMAFMRRAIADMFATYPVTETDKLRVAEKVVSAVGAQTLAETIADLELRATPETGMPVDNWFVEIMHRADSPVLIEEGHLWLRRNPTVRFRVRNWNRRHRPVSPSINMSVPDLIELENMPLGFQSTLHQGLRLLGPGFIDGCKAGARH